MSFPGSVLDALAARPGHPAVEHGDQVVTKGGLLAMIGTIAATECRRWLRPARGSSSACT
jgi:hypothetical protein